MHGERQQASWMPDSLGTFHCVYRREREEHRFSNARIVSSQVVPSTPHFGLEELSTGWECSNRNDLRFFAVMTFNLLRPDEDERWENGTVVHLPTLCMFHVQGVAGGLPILIKAISSFICTSHTENH
jgi:hypothetical protein